MGDCSQDTQTVTVCDNVGAGGIVGDWRTTENLQLCLTVVIRLEGASRRGRVRGGRCLHDFLLGFGWLFRKVVSVTFSLLCSLIGCHLSTKIKTEAHKIPEIYIH